MGLGGDGTTLRALFTCPGRGGEASSSSSPSSADLAASDFRLSCGGGADLSARRIVRRMVQEEDEAKTVPEEWTFFAANVDLPEGEYAVVAAGTCTFYF